LCDPAYGSSRPAPVEKAAQLVFWRREYEERRARGVSWSSSSSPSSDSFTPSSTPFVFDF
jgi:hypothetical protein